MPTKAGMWHHVGSTMKIVGNTLLFVGDKERKGRLPTILLVTAIAATQDVDRHRSITLNLHVKKKVASEMNDSWKRTRQTMEQGIGRNKDAVHGTQFIKH